MKKILLILLLIRVSVSVAAPFNGDLKQFKQPDGTMVDLKLYGNEYYMRAEGLDGYTLVRNPKTNWICYAKLSKDESELVASGIIYKGSKTNPSGLRNDLPQIKHLDLSKEARSLIVKKNQKLLGGGDITKSGSRLHKGPQTIQLSTTPINPVSGSIKGLCIVVDFSDEVGVLPMTEFENFCNDLNYSNFGNNGSLRKFYSDISGGILDYENVVYGYYRAPLTFAQYDAMPYAVGAQQILGLALDWIDAQGFDFSTLSTNPDGSIVAINLMYTGNPPNWAQGMWHHKGNYNGFVADGVFSDDYNCSPANSPLQLAVVAHENGHMIGKWPDTYKYDSNHGTDGIGAFDLMCWYGDYQNPVPPNPLFTANCGWKNVVDLTNYNGINTDTANSLTCYAYNNINNPNEFFLFENRTKTGRSTFMPDEGLTIWKINRDGDNQSWDHEVYLEHANGDNDNHNGACFKQLINDEYSDVTSPAATFPSGDPSGLHIWDVGPVGNILEYKLGAGQASSALRVAYLNLSGDNNANNYLEPGESADLNIKAYNYGQASSGNAVVTCTAIGLNASYVTVNSAAFNAGILNVSQNAFTAFNINISAAAPLGTVLTFKFLISDGIDSIYITKDLVLGVPYVMNNLLVQTCSGVFYDPGELSNYSAGLNYTKIIRPQTGKKLKAEFTSFDLEDEPNCAYDWLEVYDGSGASAALIGTYCGSNSPGTIVSTAANGHLTFKFHSDGGTNGTGWVAILSCETVTGVNESLFNADIEISPNPSNGIFNIKSSDAKPAEVSLVNVLGKEISKFELNENLEINLQDKEAGIYFLNFRNESGTITKKIILNK